MASKKWRVGIILICFILGSTLWSYASDPAAEAPKSSYWILAFMGRLHPMVVHFPISFILLAGVIELFQINHKHKSIAQTVRVLVYSGGFFGMVSVAFGWLLMFNEEIEGQLMERHELLGIITGVLSILTMLQLYRSQLTEQRGDRRKFRVLLMGTAIGVTLAGHYGAKLTHGSNYLEEVTPWGQQSPAVSITDFDTDGPLNGEDQLKLLMQVRGVFAHKCYKCHSDEKEEGELRLDSRAAFFKGGENGQIVVAGSPRESEMIRRVNLPDGHDDVMPSKGKLLSEEERALLALWVEQGAPWPENAETVNIFREAELALRKPALPANSLAGGNLVDIWVSKYFESEGLDYGPMVSDAQLLRRLSLDIVGLLPSWQEVTEFSTDNSAAKLQHQVEKLFQNKEAYTIHWLSFWNDILRNDYTGTGYITRGRFGITDWLYESVYENKPYHTMVKELLNPSEEAKGFIAGIKWRGTVNASQRTEMQAAQNVAQVILGLNLKCASCHDSFISNWKLEEAYAFANIFADTTLEINRCEKPIGKYAGTRILWSELGTIDSTANRKEKLAQLSEKLVQPENGRMYRTIVNRIWAQLMGRGIIAPVDEMDNLPWSQDLLDDLSYAFVQNGYDIQWLIKEIVTSKIYRAASVSVAKPEDIVSEDFVFKGRLRQRLTAEQFTDAISQVIYPMYGYRDLKYNPYQDREIDTLPPFFARASLVANNSFLTALGRPNREVVATSRNSEASLLEALELTNGAVLTDGLKSGATVWKNQGMKGSDIIEKCYRELLSRPVNPQEKAVALKQLGDQPTVADIQDFFWAMLLHPEFQIIY